MRHLSGSSPRGGEGKGSPKRASFGVDGSPTRGKRLSLGGEGSAVGGSIQVCVRVRPLNAAEEKDGICVQVLTSQAPKSDAVIIEHPSKKHEQQQFVVDLAFNSFNNQADSYASQKMLFDKIGSPLVQSCAEGYNTCLFAYGQTGSGKTFTMTGPRSPKESRGLVPRIAEKVFDSLALDEDNYGEAIRYKVNVQYVSQCSVSHERASWFQQVEIYNETLRDLLATPDKESKKDEELKKKLEVRQHPTLGVFIQGVTDTPVRGVDGVLECLDFGMKARAVGATKMNEQSSRSHCVFTIEVQRTKRVADGRVLKLRSKVNLVDLAGSERTNRTGATGDRLKEGCAINKSLANLSTVINSLAKKSEVPQSPTNAGAQNTDHVPFRNSKLTYLLQDSLTGNSKTVMLAAISPSARDYEETRSTLQFAQSAKKVRMKAAKINEECSVESLKAEVSLLKRQVSDLGIDDKRRLQAEAELEAAEALAAKYGQNIEERLDYAKRCEEMRKQVLKDWGLTLGELGDTVGLGKAPKLVALNLDPGLSECLVYFIRKGERKVGSDPSCDIYLTGLRMKPIMAILENKDDENMTISHQDGRVLLNTRALKDSAPVPLKHNDKIRFGLKHCYRVEVPTVADGDGGVGDITPCRSAARSNLQESLQEVVPDDESDYFQSCCAYFEELRGRLHSETRVACFLRRFKSLSPLVEEANALAGELFRSTRFEFTLEAMDNLATHQTQEPEFVIRVREHPKGQDRFRSIVRKMFKVKLHRLANRLTGREENQEKFRVMTEAEFREDLDQMRDAFAEDAPASCWSKSSTPFQELASTDIRRDFGVGFSDEAEQDSMAHPEGIRSTLGSRRRLSTLATLSSDGLASDIAHEADSIQAELDEQRVELEAKSAALVEQGKELEQRELALKEAEARLRRREEALGSAVGRRGAASSVTPPERASPIASLRSATGASKCEDMGLLQEAMQSTLATCVTVFREASECRRRDDESALRRHIERLESVTSSQINTCRRLLDDVGRDLDAIRAPTVGRSR